MHANVHTCTETHTHAHEVACTAIGNSERHVRKASHRGSKQQ